MDRKNALGGFAVQRVVQQTVSLHVQQIHKFTTQDKGSGKIHNILTCQDVVDFRTNRSSGICA